MSKRMPFFADSDIKAFAQRLSTRGRMGDSELVHVNEAELELLELLSGGQGTVNPETGLREYWSAGRVAESITDAIGGALSGISRGADAISEAAGISKSGDINSRIDNGFSAVDSRNANSRIDSGFSALSPGADWGGAQSAFDSVNEAAESGNFDAAFADTWSGDVNTLGSDRGEGFSRGITDALDTGNRYAEAEQEARNQLQSEIADAQASLEDRARQMGNVEISATDRENLALTLAGEIDPSYTDWSSPKGRQEAANILGTIDMRRQVNIPGRFGSPKVGGKRISAYDDYSSVVHQESQYSTWNDKAKRDVAKGNLAEFGDSIYSVVDDYFSGRLATTTPEATHYLNERIANPSWAKSYTKLEDVGPHSFYTDKDWFGGFPEAATAYLGGQPVAPEVEAVNQFAVNSSTPLNQIGSWADAIEVSPRSKPVPEVTPNIKPGISAPVTPVQQASLPDFNPDDNISASRFDHAFDAIPAASVAPSGRIAGAFDLFEQDQPASGQTPSVRIDNAFSDVMTTASPISEQFAAVEALVASLGLGIDQAALTTSHDYGRPEDGVGAAADEALVPNSDPRLAAIVEQARSDPRLRENLAVQGIYIDGEAGALGALDAGTLTADEFDNFRSAMNEYQGVGDGILEKGAKAAGKYVGPGFEALNPNFDETFIPSKHSAPNYKVDGLGVLGAVVGGPAGVVSSLVGLATDKDDIVVGQLPKFSGGKTADPTSRVNMNEGRGEDYTSPSSQQGSTSAPEEKNDVKVSSSYVDALKGNTSSGAAHAGFYAHDLRDSPQSDRDADDQQVIYSGKAFSISEQARRNIEAITARSPHRIKGDIAVNYGAGYALILKAGGDILKFDPTPEGVAKMTKTYSDMVAYAGETGQPIESGLYEEIMLKNEFADYRDPDIQEAIIDMAQRQNALRILGDSQGATRAARDMARLTRERTRRINVRAQAGRLPGMGRLN